jgi:hypothetical protein
VATAETVVRRWRVGTACADLDTDQPGIVPCCTIASAVRQVHRRWPRGSSPGWSHQPSRGAGRSPTQVRQRACQTGRIRTPIRGRTAALGPYVDLPGGDAVSNRVGPLLAVHPLALSLTIRDPTGARPGRIGRSPRWIRRLPPRPHHPGFRLRLDRTSRAMPQPVTRVRSRGDSR